MLIFRCDEYQFMMQDILKQIFKYKTLFSQIDIYEFVN